MENRFRRKVKLLIFIYAFYFFISTVLATFFIVILILSLKFVLIFPFLISSLFTYYHFNQLKITLWILKTYHTESNEIMDYLINKMRQEKKFDTSQPRSVNGISFSRRSFIYGNYRGGIVTRRLFSDLLFLLEKVHEKNYKLHKNRKLKKGL